MTNRASQYFLLCLVGATLYAAFVTQGIPLWDDDFTTWFRSVHDKSLTKIFLEMLLPVSNQPEHWGFVDRPIQSFIYKIFYLISGYTAWPYFLFRSIVYGFLVLGVFRWIVLFSKNGLDKVTLLFSLVGSILFMTSPGPNAALILHSDLAPVSECLWVWITFYIFQNIEITASKIEKNLPFNFKWQWIGISFLVYFGTKSKADLKLIPLLLTGFLFLAKPKLIKSLAIPLLLMFLLMVPWSVQLFKKLPPWVPGSQGSSVGYMWQPASLTRALDFIRDKQGENLWAGFNTSPLALLPILSPFALAVFVWLIFRGGLRSSRIRSWLRFESISDRVLLWVSLWLILMIAAVSPLPELNPAFRVRYGILTQTPFFIFFAGLIIRTFQSKYFSRLTSTAKSFIGISVVLLLSLQAFINSNRSFTYRKDLGRVMVSVNKAYETIEVIAKDFKMFTLSPYLIYDYKPKIGQAFEERKMIGSIDDLNLASKSGRAIPNSTLVLSWTVQPSDSLLFKGSFDGCNQSLFDKVFGCELAPTTFIYQWIGTQQPSLYSKYDEWMAKQGPAGTIIELERFLQKYPESQAAKFLLGLAASLAGDLVKSCNWNQELVKEAPWEKRYLHNLGDCLIQQKRYDEARAIYLKLVKVSPNEKIYTMALNFIDAQKNTQK